MVREFKNDPFEKRDTIYKELRDVRQERDRLREEGTELELPELPNIVDLEKEGPMKGTYGVSNSVDLLEFRSRVEGHRQADQLQRKVHKLLVDAKKEVMNPKRLRQLTERGHEVLKNKGLEVIAKHGWSEFREALARLSYSEIIKANLDEIETLIAQVADESANQTDPRLDLNAYNKLFGSDGLVETLPKQYSYPDEHRREKLLDKTPFYITDKGNKLSIEGFAFKAACEVYPREALQMVPNPVIRCYFNLKTNRSVEVFERLFEKIKEKTCEGTKTYGNRLISYVNLSLNLDIPRTTGGIPTEVKRNPLILYTNSLGAEVALPGVLEAVSELQREYPELFKLSPAEQVQAKIGMLSDFMIPMGQIGYVEQHDRQSYHQADRVRLARAFKFSGSSEDIFTRTTNHHYFVLQQLRELQSQMEQWSPKNPGKFENIPGRFPYMPSLVFRPQYLYNNTPAWKE